MLQMYTLPCIVHRANPADSIDEEGAGFSTVSRLVRPSDIL
jgi:hypothetical protein